MLDIFSQLLQYILPLHPSRKLLESSNSQLFCRNYKPQSIHGLICLASYQVPLIKAVVTANKFHNDTHAAQLLASLLQTYLATLPRTPTILIPIPLSKQRERERGYNQVTRVLSYLPPSTHLNIVSLLVRLRNTHPQTTLHRTDRLKNMKGVFSLDDAYPLPEYTRFIIVDDVLTTGATMLAAKETLLPNLPTGSTLMCVSLSH